MTRFIARYGQPDFDETTDFDDPRPLMVTRWLTYNQKNLRVWFGLRWETPASAPKNWEFLFFQNATSKERVDRATAERVFNSRLAPSPDTFEQERALKEKKEADRKLAEEQEAARMLAREEQARREQEERRRAAVAKHERDADALLQIAKELIRNNKNDKAIDRLEKIISEFKTTSAAKEAKELLKKLNP